MRPYLPSMLAGGYKSVHLVLSASFREATDRPICSRFSYETG